MKSSVYKVLFSAMLSLVLAAGSSFAQSNLADRMTEGEPGLEMSDASVEGYERSSYGIEGGFEFNEGNPNDPNNQQQVILVKTGQRVYCSQCGKKLDDTVTFIDVPFEQAGNYYDDGSHFDDYPRDGLPTNVTEVRDQYIGPYCDKLKKRLTNYYLKVRQPQRWGYYMNANYPRYWSSIAFYGLPAVTLEPDVPLNKLSFWDGFMDDTLEYWKELAINPYEGFTVHEDMFAAPKIMQRGFMMGPDMEMMMMEGMDPMMMEGQGYNPSHPTSVYKGKASQAQMQYR